MIFTDPNVSWRPVASPWPPLKATVPHLISLPHLSCLPNASAGFPPNLKAATNPAMMTNPAMTNPAMTMTNPAMKTSLLATKINPWMKTKRERDEVDDGNKDEDNDGMLLY